MLIRRALTALLSVLLALTVCVVFTSDAQAATPAAKYYAIGDSVMLDAKPSLPKVLPSIRTDADVSRQVADGIAVLRYQRARHTVGGITIFGLGTNGSLSVTQMQQIISLTAGHKLVMVTSHCPYCSWTNTNNRVIRAWCTPARHCWIAEFAVHAAWHPEWFGGDGVHMAIGGIGAGWYAHYVWLACHNAHQRQ